MESNLENRPTSESTKIEQARVFSQVVIQAELAKKFPRNMQEVFRKLEETFQFSPELVDASKYVFNRGNTQIIGHTIKFARAVAECVGNINISTKELARSEKQTEIMVVAWDLETNTSIDRTVIIKHEQYAATDPKQLTKERDIYENNHNVAGRRLRECMLGVIPKPALQKAEELVERFLMEKYPIEKHQNFVKGYMEALEKFHISQERIIAARGNRPPETWIKEDFAWLSMANRLLKQESIKPEELFPPVELAGAEQIKDQLTGSKF